MDKNQYYNIARKWQQEQSDMQDNLVVTSLRIIVIVIVIVL